MRKIKSVKELAAEKDHLRQRRCELEKAIQYDWRDLTDSLKPVNVSRQLLSAALDKKENEPEKVFFFKKLVRLLPGRTKNWLEKLRIK